MDEIQKAARVLWRYLVAKARYKKSNLDVSPADVEYRLRRAGGRFYISEGNEILTNPGGSPVITVDAKDQDFLAAINGDDGVLDVDKAYLDQLRKFVLEGTRDI